MQTSIDYVNHVGIVKELNLYSTLNETQKKYEERFEAVYAKAQEADVTLESAKEFLNSLSRRERIALQKFEGLAELFDVDSLSDEGAYNLLVHRYEKYDWNNDGETQIGEGSVLQTIPQNMDDESKKAWVEAINAMGEDALAVMSVSLTLNEEFLKHQIAQRLSRMSDSELDEMQEYASFDVREFIQETLLKPYTPQTITFLDIMEKIDGVINPINGAYSSPEKTLAEENESALAKAIQETKTTEEIIAEYRAKPGQNGIAYEGMYEQTQADFLAKHEEYFEQEYELYDKYKESFTPLYSNYAKEKADAIKRELRAQFPDLQEMRRKAYYGGSQEDKEAWEDTFFDYQAYNKYLKEKYDMEISPNMMMAGLTPQSTKAYNHAVYDALEEGLSVEEATAKARQVLSIFGDNEALTFTLMFFSGYEHDDAEPVEEEIDYDKQIDLRDVGFEHNFSNDAYVETYGKDSTGVKSRIMYDIKLYSFLLENDELVDKKLEELKARAYETQDGKAWYDFQNESGNFNEAFKASFKERYERALYSKEIYDKYADRIFSSEEES
jgi:hypothetical protein